MDLVVTKIEVNIKEVIFEAPIIIPLVLTIWHLRSLREKTISNRGAMVRLVTS